MRKIKEEEEEEVYTPLSAEEELKLYKMDGMYGMYFALNRKLNELSESLNNFRLDIAKEDRTFERYQKLSVGIKEMVQTVDWIRINYLKVDEEEAKQIEKKGVPLIETLIKGR